ncbi:succinate dehydrogenase, cytochrome b556 subunit [Microbaculum marinum]|uniref:Succinate dehydrogenase cytochrome b556 subunit n=1 Tax=Microbaculum marinum TaxID=1764581 RepID=A0AAW9RD99_9HYPH
MADVKTGANRPLSPHLQVFRPIVTMVMSIVHRITGAGLYFGMALLAWWLVAAASGPDSFAFVNGLFGSIIGQIVLFGFTWTLVHHLLSGLRYLIWDTGHGFDLKTADAMAWGAIIGSVTLTILLWIIGYLAM